MPVKKESDVRITLMWHQWIGLAAIGAVIVLFGGFLTWYLPKELSQARELSKADTAAQLQPTNDKLSRLTEKIAALTTIVVMSSPDAPRKIPQLLNESLHQKTSNDPALNLQIISGIANEAKKRRIETSPSDISQIGREILSDQTLFTTPAARPIAWDAVTNLLNYCSFLREPEYRQLQLPTTPTTLKISQEFDFGVQVQNDNAVVGIGRPVALRDAAVAERIGTPLRPQDQTGFALIKFDSGPNTVLKLDDHYLKNIVFTGVTIEYDGGALVMDNVSFVNCVFHLKETERSKDFSKAVFASLHTSFTAA
ncbi:MAG: hypothetical protein ACHP7P_04155 [Terriglobales bacterium]